MFIFTWKLCETCNGICSIALIENNPSNFNGFWEFQRQLKCNQQSKVNLLKTDEFGLAFALLLLPFFTSLNCSLWKKIIAWQSGVLVKINLAAEVHSGSKRPKPATNIFSSVCSVWSHEYFKATLVISVSRW